MKDRINSELKTKESEELKRAVAKELKEEKSESDIREVEKAYGIQRNG